ncbi:MAG TPA: PEGA domain-containing protein [Vicinamibacterales bacterium]|nr:PEGA domain-containing protein [Vicinamibacterales bacterium]
MTSKRLVIFSCACITTAVVMTMLWPAEAAAQRRAVRRAPVRTSVFVGVGFYRPYYYYRPFFYTPFYSPFYDPFYAGWYAPYYAQYPRYPYYYSRAWASARLEVKPRSAQVYVDGYYVGVVDQFDGVFQRLDLPTGEHEISVYLPGHRTYTQRTLFRPGATYHFKAILEPLPAGTPEEPVPQPAPGAPRGGDPYDPQGYGDPRERRDPRDPRDPRGPERTMPLPDRPAERRGADSRDFGTLTLRVQPLDAVVIIDGERWDSPEGGSRLVVQLTGGSHRLEVRKEGFRTYTSTVQIRSGEAQSLNISLTPGGMNP